MIFHNFRKRLVPEASYSIFVILDVFLTVSCAQKKNIVVPYVHMRFTTLYRSLPVFFSLLFHTSRKLLVYLNSFHTLPRIRSERFQVYYASTLKLRSAFKGVIFCLSSHVLYLADLATPKSSSSRLQSLDSFRGLI